LHRVHPAGLAALVALGLVWSGAPLPASAASTDGPALTTISVPSPTVEPITGGTPDKPVNAAPPAVLHQYHYAEKEFFLSGAATAYMPAGTWGEDGRWSVQPVSAARYKTRIVVRYPEDPARFNGIVLVEWLNETSGRDEDPDFAFTYPELLRQGFGYVGVSAQALGTVGSAGFSLPIPGYHPQPMVVDNPARYRGLSHPGDNYSYDIFSQAGEAVLHPHGGVRPFGGLHPKYLIADGESQSASYLTTYVDAFAPLTHVFAGYLIHSRGNNGSPVNSAAPAQPDVVRIRTDLHTPVLMAETETDLFGLGYYPAQQPDTRSIHTWEMAGTSHVDQWTLTYGIRSGHVWSPSSVVPSFAECGTINDGPQRYVMRASVAALARWVRTGAPPPVAPRFAFADGGTAIARDRDGNALGAIRTPAVDVPTSSLSGDFKKGESVICSLFGSSAPFSTATLAHLYPTHADYVTKVKADVDRAVRRGYVLTPDARTIVAQAEASTVR
jgi:hypothetical protein